ncbi:helix-turn-helix domain-containing protein [Gynuella sp.]|uniref:AraC-like ligand-binding domain-containing protein n=1 Tax=Gynuella sp. TaxID=2969146 RepID=UPI003D116B71
MRKFLIHKHGSQTLSTQHIARQERFDFWMEVVCREFIKMDCRLLTDNDFNGSLRNHRLNEIGFTEIHSQPQAFIRTNRHLSHLDEDPMLVSIPVYRNVNRTIDSRSFSASRGDITLFDSGRAQELVVAGDFEGLILRVPKSKLSQFLKHPEDYGGRIIPVSHSMGLLTSNFIKTLASQLGNIQPDTATSIVDNFLQLLATSLQSIYKQKPVDQTTALKNILLSQIKEYIESQLHNVFMTPPQIARNFGISLRSLYLLFEQDEQTPSRYILNKRLSHCYHALQNIEYIRLNITEIAFKYGFNDASHFCKAFKKKYGLSPRAIRSHFLRCLKH